MIKDKIRSLIQRSEEAEDMMYNLERIYNETKEEGKQIRTEEIAKKLLIMKMPLKDIIEATELTEEEIKRLKDSMN